MRVGIVGAGNIVKSFLDAIEQLHEVSCEAIFAQERSKYKAEALMDSYNFV